MVEVEKERIAVRSVADLYVTEREACALLGCSRDTLARWRKAGTGPTGWRRLGGRIVYERGALARFIEPAPLR